MKTDEQETKLRIAQLHIFERAFITDLKEAGIVLNETAMCKICSSSIELSVKDTDKKSKRYGYAMWAGDINLYAAEDSLGTLKENEIGFGTTGPFTPKNTAAYWRTIHAASILQNWEKVCNLVNKYCSEYVKMLKKFEFESANQLIKLKGKNDRVKCPECKGAGQIKDTSGGRCSSCNGSGKCYGERCGSCDGCGYNGIIRCPICKGEGKKANSQKVDKS